MIYLTLFYEFFKMGLFAIGGGMATLPFLQSICERYDWFTPQMLADMVAISEATPGPIGINMATYAGFQAAGVLGSIVATFSIVLPAFILVMIIARMLSRFQQSPGVQAAFYGLRPAVAGLIASAAYSVASISMLHIDAFQASHALLDLFDWKAILLFAVLIVATQFKKIKKIHPIFLIALAGVIGVVFKF
nr:chromate transporter [bacterium]